MPSDIKYVLLVFLFLIFGGTVIPFSYAQDCDCAIQGTNFITPLRGVSLEASISNSNGPSGCSEYQEINGFIEGRKYLFSFCPDTFQGAKFPPGVELFLLLKDANNRTVAFTPQNNLDCSSGGYTLTTLAPSTGPLRAYIFKMPGCGELVTNSLEARNTQFGYREDCNKGVLEKQDENCPFTLIYKNPSGAENYQLQYWNGLTWVNYDRSGSRLSWQNTSPNYVFKNVTIKRDTRFRVLHEGGNCGGAKFSDEIVLTIPPICPTRLDNNLNIAGTRTRYCTNGSLDLKLEDDCLPETKVNFRWIGEGAPAANQSSITFSAPNTLQPPSPCSAYVYRAEITFLEIPGCTLTSKEHRVEICKVLPFTLDTLPPYRSKICQNDFTRMQITPDPDWVISNFEEATLNWGYSFIWNCNGCVGGDPPQNNFITPPLRWNSICGRPINVSVTQSIEGCESENPVNYRVSIICSPNAHFTLQPNPLCVFNAASSSPYQAQAEARVNPAPPGVVYFWDCDNCLTPPPNTPGPHTLSWSSPGTKTVRLRAVSAPPCPEDFHIETVVINEPIRALALDCGAERVCVNEPRRIAITPAAPGAVYEWNCPDCRPLPSGANANVSWNAVGQKTITVTGYTPGCPNDKITDSCVVNVVPPADANFTASPSPICVQNLLSLNVNTPLPGAVYSWNCSGCEPAPTGSGPFSVSWQTPGVITLRLTAINPPCSANTFSRTVTVNQNARPELELSEATLCANAFATIRANAIGAFGTVSYSWSCDGCRSSGGAFQENNWIAEAGPFQLSWNTPGAKTLRACTRVAGCVTDTLCAVREITVTPGPPSEINISTNLLCSGNTLTFSAPEVAGASYQWNCDGCSPAPNNTQGPFTAEWNNGGVKTIRLVTATPSCNALTLTAAVTVNALPEIDIRANVNSICAVSGRTRLTPRTINGFGAPNYSWSCQGCNFYVGSSSQNAPAELGWSAEGLKTVSLCAKNLAGCPERINCDTAVITVNPAPALTNLQTSSPSLCVTDSLRLSFTRNPPEAKVWVAHCQGCNLEGDTLNRDFATLHWSAPGTQTITLNAQLGECLAAAPPVTVTVNQIKRPELTGIAENVCLGGELNISANAAGWGVNGYYWNCDNCISQSPGFQENRPINPGPYRVSWNSEGNKTLRVCAQAPGCDTLCASKTVIAQALPSLPNIEGPLPRCGQGPISFTASYAGVLAQDLTLRLYTQSAGGNPIAAYKLAAASFPGDTVYISPNIATTTAFYYDVFNEATGCVSSGRQSFTARVNSNLGEPRVQTEPVCQGNASRFTATMGTPAGNTFRLYSQSAGGVPIAASSDMPWAYLLPLTATATFYLEAYDNNTLCASVRRLPFSLQVFPPPASPQVFDTLICGAGPVPLRFIHSSPSDTLKVWDSPAGGNLISSHAPPFASPYIQVPAPSSAFATYYLEAISAGVSPGCVSINRARAFIIRVPLPQTPQLASEPERICGSATLRLRFQLQDTLGNRVALLGNNNEILAFTDTRPYEIITPLIEGPVNWKAVAINTVAVCTSAALPLPIIYAPLPGAPITRNESRCGAGVITFLALPSSAYGIHLRLYTTPAGGAPLAVDSLPAYEFATPALAASEVFYIAAYDPVTGCESPRTRAIATVFPKPPMPMVAPARFCQGMSAFLEGSLNAEAPFSVLLYSPTHDLRTVERSPFRFELPELTATATYYFQSRGANHCFSDSLPVIVEYLPRPLPPPPVLLSRCGAGSVTFTVALAPLGGGDQIGLFGSLASQSALSVSSAPYSLTTPGVTTHTTFYLRALYSGFDCPSEAIEAPVRVYPALPNLTPLSDFRCAPGALTFTLQPDFPPGVQIHIYSSPAAQTPLQTLVQFPFIYSTPALNRPATYYAQAEDKITGCRSPFRSPITIHFQDSLPLPPAWVASYFCVEPNALSTPLSLALPPNRDYNRLQLVHNQDTSYLLSAAPLAAPDTLSYAFPYNAQPQILEVRGVIPHKGCFTNKRLVNIYPAPSLAPTQLVPERCGSGPVSFTLQADTITQRVLLYETLTDTAPFAVSARPFHFSISTQEIHKTIYVRALNVETGCFSGRQPLALRIYSLPASPPTDTLSRCQAGFLVFTFSAPNGAPRALRLYENPGSGQNYIQQALPDTNGAYYTVTTPSISQTQTFYITSFDFSSGCESALTPIVARIDYLPNLTLSAITRGCAGDTLYLEAQGEPAELYRFIGPDGWDTVSYFGRVSRTGLNPEKTGVYSLIAALGACTTSSILAPPVRVLGLYPTPIVLPPPNATFCQENALRLAVANREVLPQTVQFQWRTPLLDTWIGRDTLILGRLNPAEHNGAYQVRAIMEGCTTAWSAPFTLRVEAPPVLRVPESVRLCVSASTFRLAVEDPEAQTFYQWQGPGRYYSAGPQMERVAWISSGGVYTLTARTAGGCEAQPQIITVHISAPLTPDSLIIPQKACQGWPFEVLLPPHAQAWQGSWQTPSGEVIESGNLRIPLLTDRDAGLYTLRLEDPLCGPYSLAYALLPQSSPPPPRIRTEANLCSNAPLRLEASPIAGAEYRWEGPGGFSSTLRAVTLPPQAPNGDYSVRAILEGCPSTAAFLSITRKAPQLRFAGLEQEVCYYQGKIILPLKAEGRLPFVWRYTVNGGAPIITTISTLEASLTLPFANRPERVEIRTLHLEDADGCLAPADSVLISLGTRSIPPPNITVGQASVCEGGWVLIEPQEPGVTLVFRNATYARLLQDGLAKGTYLAEYISPQGCASLVSFTIPQLPLPQITHLATSAQANSSWIDIDWRQTPEAKHYTLRYRAEGDSAYTLLENILSPVYRLSPVLPEKRYTFELQTHCKNGTVGDYSEPATIRTLFSNCPVPQDRFILEGLTQVSYHWKAAPNARCYQVYWRDTSQKGFERLALLYAPDTQFVFPTLLKNAVYGARVRALCADSDCLSAISDFDATAWSEETYFVHRNGNFRLAAANETKPFLYPNPTKGKIYLESSPTYAGITVTDLVGRALSVTVAQQDDFAEIDLSELPNGWYIILITDKCGFNQAIKVRKEE